MNQTQILARKTKLLRHQLIWLFHLLRSIKKRELNCWPNDGGKRERLHTNNWWILIVYVGWWDPMKRSLKPFTPLSLTSSPIVTRCWVIVIFYRKKVFFIPQFFIKHQPQDHLHHHISFFYHSSPSSPRRTEMTRDIGSSWNGINWTPNDSYFDLLLGLAIFLPDHFTDTLHKNISSFDSRVCFLTLAINLDFFIFRSSGAQLMCEEFLISWEHQLVNEH